MIPQTSGTPSSGTAIPNLIRRSVRSDTIAAPGIASRASAVNSTTDVSLNGYSVSSARWNKHYLIPKINTGDDQTDPVASFATPDWVVVTRNGPKAFAVWNNAVRDTTSVDFVLGRYAFAIYDEGGLLDLNVASYPTGTTAIQSGGKGSVAFADLTVLPYPIPNPSSGLNPVYQIDRLVGWRNYATTHPTNDFPGTQALPFASNFQSSSVPATAYFSFIVSNTTGFLTTNGDVWNGRTNQAFVNRQELIDYFKTTSASVNALNSSERFRASLILRPLVQRRRRPLIQISTKFE